MWMWLKVKYRASVNMSLINSIKGKLLIDITKGGKLSIGSFLMTSGPCYIKLGEQGKLEIGDKCWIGANCTITAGTEIGDGAAIAAGAVVKGRIPSHELCVWGGTSKIHQKYLSVLNTQLRGEIV